MYQEIGDGIGEGKGSGRLRHENGCDVTRWTCDQEPSGLVRRPLARFAGRCHRHQLHWVTE